MKRIQRKRTKGWRMPDNTIYVGRPTKWGNPFKLEYYDSSYTKGCIMYYCTNRKILDPWIYYDSKYLYQLNDILYFYKEWILGHLTDKIGLPEIPDISELKDKDLACWCPLDKPCHADVLIELLNQ